MSKPDYKFQPVVDFLLFYIGAFVTVRLLFYFVSVVASGV